MDKLDPSSSGRQRRNQALACALLLSFASSLEAITLSQTDALRIGKKIWQNECNGTVSGLTSWNAGEDFASLGIGHFIWYPAGRRGPFEESFPKLVAFMQDRHAGLPDWLAQAGSCLWNSRSEFMNDQKSPRMTQLRQLLARTVDLQTQFLIDRLQNALPKMLDQTAGPDRSHLEEKFRRVAATSQGCYALIDYVNFKGEGVLQTERYQGEGWGLLQVLETMQTSESDAVKEFSHAAGVVLKRRVANSPPARHESRWLSGWLNRVNSYSRG